ncbi:MAG: peptidylprolyl isomerase [Fimbriiglobus sp.]
MSLLLLAGFLLADMPPAKVEVPGPVVAAKVNGETILLAEIDVVLKKYPSAAGPLTDSQAKQLREEVLQDFIDDLLVQQYVKQHGPKVEAAEVDKLWAGLTESLKKQGKTVPEYLKEHGITEAQAREQWRQNLQYQKWVESQAKEPELKAYFTKYLAVFERSTIRVSHIMLRVSPGSPPGERATAKAKLDDIRGQILAGKLLFADAAKKFSVDSSASKGGDLGFISRRDPLVEESFAAVAFSMPVNGLSEVVETRFGLHLIWVMEKKAGTPTTFEKSLDLVRENFAEDLRVQLVAELRKKAVISTHIPEK